MIRRQRVIALILMLLWVRLAHAAPLGSGFVDSDSQLLIYSGTWSTVSDTGAIGGAFEATSDGAVTFDLYAAGFTLFWMNSSNAQVDVCVDGDCVQVNADGSTLKGRGDFTGLASGLKTVTVTRVSGSFQFEGVYVYPEPSLVQEGEAVVRDTFVFDGENYDVEWRLSFTAGELMTISLLTVMVTVQLSKMAFDIWNRQ